MSRQFRLKAAANTTLMLAVLGLVWSIIEVIAFVCYLIGGNWGQAVQELLLAFGFAAVGLTAGYGFTVADDRLAYLDGRRRELTIWDRWDQIITEGGHDAVLQQFPESFARIFTPAGQPCPSPRISDRPELHNWDRHLTKRRRSRDDEWEVTGGKYRCMQSGCEAETANSTLAESQQFEVKCEVERLQYQENARIKAEHLKTRRAIQARAEEKRKAEEAFMIEAGVDPDRVALPSAEVMAWGQKKPVRTITFDDVDYARERHMTEEALRRQIILGGGPIYYTGGRLAGSSDRW